MPYSVRKRKCRRSDGTSGNYVVVLTGTSMSVGCHKTRSSANSQVRALNAAKSPKTISERAKEHNEAVLAAHRKKKKKKKKC